MDENPQTSDATHLHVAIIGDKIINEDDVSNQNQEKLGIKSTIVSTLQNDSPAQEKEPEPKATAEVPANQESEKSENENKPDSEEPQPDNDDPYPEQPQTVSTGGQTENFEEQQKPETADKSPSPTPKQKKTNRNDIPPNLKPYVTDPPSSNVYQTLCGLIPMGLTQEEIQQLLSDLNRYVDVCIEKDLIGEAVFVQGLASDIRNDKSIEKGCIQENFDDIDKRLKEQKQILEDESAKYDKQIEDIKQETNEKLAKLDQKYNQAVVELDKDWAKPEHAQMYTKPSAELLNLRHMLTKMVKSRQLDHVDVIAAQIEQLEKEELAAHQRRMQADYDVADRHLQTVYQSEKQSIIGSCEKRINDILCEKEKNSRKYISKIETLEREKQVYVSKYRNSGLDTKEDRGKNQNKEPQVMSRPSVRSFSEQKLPDFVTTAKLPPPTFVPKKRTLIQSVSQQPTIKKPRNGRSPSSKSRLYDGL